LGARVRWLMPVQYSELAAHRSCAENQNSALGWIRYHRSVFIEHGDNDRLGVIATKFFGDGHCMCFSLLQSREFFTNLVSDCNAMIIGLEENSGSSQASCSGQR
jgi:hypothetical protein